MVIKPERSWKYDYFGCHFKINNLSHMVTFHSKLLQLEQESITVCSDTAQFSRAISAHSLPQRVGILSRNQKCKGWRCKLIYIGWINKVLLYSTGNYIQYPVISHNGKEYKKNAYICTKSFCWTVFSFTINICFSIIKAISFLKKMDSLIFIFMVLVPECLLIL